MLLLRQLSTRLTPIHAHVATEAKRLYAKKAAATALNIKMKHIHQETLRHINPCARINISSDIYLKVRSSDVVQYPAGDAFIAELHGGNEKNCSACMQVQVSENEQEVSVKLTNAADSSNFHCELAVPIRASLNIQSQDVVSVANMYGGTEVIVQARKGIKCTEIRSGKIMLNSEEGDIECEGLLLGQNTQIGAKGQGHISLNKLQGDKLSCKSAEGNITVNSCYVEESKFETDTGNLQLKNVHKKAEVCVHNKGDVNMTGVHGNICIRSNGGTMNLQLSELTGDNVIMADAVENSVINISDSIEENSYIEITSSPIILDPSLSHLSDCISEDKQSFRMSLERDNHNKLMICTKGGGVQLGKLSWADSVRATMGARHDKN